MSDDVVVSDPEILRGTPVFAGTRVPVADVMASIRKGIDHDRIRRAYPRMSEEQFQWAIRHAG